MPAICCLNGRMRGSSHPWLESCPKAVIAEKPVHYKEVARTCSFTRSAAMACCKRAYTSSDDVEQLTQFTAINCLPPASSLPVKVLTYR